MAQQKTVSAKQIMADIRAGATDDFLMNRYDLSEKGLKSLFKKLVTAKILTQAEMDRRAPLQVVEAEEIYEVSVEEAGGKRSASFQATTAQTVFKCPSCGMPQNYEFRVCPQCGVIVEKFTARQRLEGNAQKDLPQQAMSAGSVEFNKSVGDGHSRNRSASYKEEPIIEPQSNQELLQPTKSSQGSMNVAPNSVESGTTASQAKQSVSAVSRETAKAAKSAVQILVADPMGGQGRAMDALGERGALLSGVTFIILFVILALIFQIVTLKTVSQIASPFLSLGAMTNLPAAGQALTKPSGSAQHSARAESRGQTSSLADLALLLKFLVIPFIPALALAAGFMFIGRVFGGKTRISSAVFATGVSLLPLSIALMIICMVGFYNIEFVLVVAFFGVSTTFLILYGALNQIMRLSALGAFLLTPALVLLAGYLAKVFVARLFFG